MSKIYIAKIPQKYDEAVFQAYCKKVDQKRLEKVLRIRPEQSRMRSLFAGFCLQQGVKEVLGIKGEEPLSLEYRFGECGKPYLSNYLDLFFNLSHSGQFVACGIGNQEIGIDIQEEQNVGERLAKRFFTQSEYEELQAVADLKARQKLFFKMWAIKESYIKLSGQGMKQGLNTFQINLKEKYVNDFANEKQAWFESWEMESGIHLSICEYEPITAKEIIFLNSEKGIEFRNEIKIM